MKKNKTNKLSEPEEMLPELEDVISVDMTLKKLLRLGSSGGDFQPSTMTPSQNALNGTKGKQGRIYRNIKSDLKKPKPSSMITG